MFSVALGVNGRRAECSPALLLHSVLSVSGDKAQQGSEIERYVNYYIHLEFIMVKVLLSTYSTLKILKNSGDWAV